jgi:GH15 family glucan-1,4-alpha-glucosidase
MKAPSLDLAIVGNSRISALIDREDDFGIPSTAFIVCTFWLIQALALQGDHRRARQQSEKLLACRNRLGFYPRTSTSRRASYGATFRRPTAWSASSMCAMRLSSRWDEAF